MGVYDAIAHFNDGAIASSDILKDMNMEPDDHMMKGLQIQNESRKVHLAYRMSEPQLNPILVGGVKITPPPPPQEKNVKNVKNRQAVGLPELFTEQNLVFDVS